MIGCYWQREAGWHDRWVGDALPREVEFAVLGGGLAGLATALRLRERGAQVVVLEAERVGFGASGRNAGFLSPLAAPVWLLGAERAREQAWAAAHVNTEIHAVARWIGEVLPAAELRPTTLRLASTGRLAEAGLGEFVRAVDRVGLAHRTQARPRLVLEMAAYTVHPYRLVRALAEHAVAAGVRIHERARVRAVEPAPRGARVRLATGAELVARKIVVCTNAYTGTIALGERVRALPVYSFMTASPPLDPAARTRLAADGVFTVEVNTAQVFHRVHGDRLLYGGIDKVLAPPGGEYAVPAGVRAGLARQQRASFGDGVPIAEAWSGRLHATATGLPIIAASTRNPAVVLDVGYGGTGVGLALACARLAAAVACEVAPAPDDARLHAAIRETRISARDAVRAVARIAARAARPWR